MTTAETPVGYSRVECPLCGANRPRVLRRVDRFNPPLTIVKCGACSMAYQDPMPDDATLESMYSEEYYTGRADYIYQDERQKAAELEPMYAARLRSISRFKSSGSLLDVGCAFGGFLNTARRRFDVFGVEVSPYSSAYARDELRLNVKTGALRAASLPDDYFDVVTLVEVFEHFTDPLAELNEVRRVLKPDGLAVIVTGNIEGLNAKLRRAEFDYLLPGHVCYFSRKTLRLALDKTGFAVTKQFFGGDIGYADELRRATVAAKGLGRVKSYAEITLRHILRHVHFGDLSVVSGMVCYARKRAPTG